MECWRPSPETGDGAVDEGKNTIVNGSPSSLTWRVEFDLRTGATISSSWTRRSLSWEPRRRQARGTAPWPWVVARVRWIGALVACPANRLLNGASCSAGGTVDRTLPTTSARCRARARPRPRSASPGALDRLRGSGRPARRVLEARRCCGQTMHDVHRYWPNREHRLHLYGAGPRRRWEPLPQQQPDLGHVRTRTRRHHATE